MDKATYFQSVYEAQFALGKKMGATVSAQILALEAFIQRSAHWHFRWWPIVGITPNAWSMLRQRAVEQSGSGIINNRGLIRAHRYNREARSRMLFEREAPLLEAWHFYESRDTTILALTEERETISDTEWLALDPHILGQQSSAVPTITRKRYAAIHSALQSATARVHDRDDDHSLRRQITALP